jgi:hypothetical protein
LNGTGWILRIETHKFLMLRKNRRVVSGVNATGRERDEGHGYSYSFSSFTPA